MSRTLWAGLSYGPLIPTPGHPEGAAERSSGRPRVVDDVRTADLSVNSRSLYR
jgi:hypothetical protein